MENSMTFLNLNHKETYIYKILITLILIKNIFSFCLKSQQFISPFPDLSDNEIFFLKKVSNDFFIVGNENSATSFSLPNLDITPYEITTTNQITYPNYIYSDSFGNIDPVVVGVNTLENPYKIKYIITENEIDYNQALYDLNQRDIKEGKFSFAYSDFKIIEPLNDKEYIGAVKIDDSINNVYSIKLQIMSFTQTSNGYIKQLGGKEYAQTSIPDQSVNDIFFIESIKKILIIRTIQDLIYFDFIDYENYFGTLQTTTMARVPFSIKDYRFKSVELSKEGKITYIASCFRKLNYLYCFFLHLKC